MKDVQYINKVTLLGTVDGGVTGKEWGESFIMYTETGTPIDLQYHKVISLHRYGGPGVGSLEDGARVLVFGSIDYWEEGAVIVLERMVRL